MDHSVKSFLFYLEWSTLLLVSTEKMVLETIFEQFGHLPHQYLKNCNLLDCPWHQYSAIDV